MAKPRDAWEQFEAIYDRLHDSVDVDKHDLDTGLEQQSTLYLEVCDLLAAVTLQRDTAKDALTNYQGQTIPRMRMAGEYKSEAALKDAAELDEGLEVRKKKLRLWQERLLLVVGLRDAMDQRGRALKELTNLYISGYFQSTSAGRAALSDQAYKDNRSRLARARLAKPNLQE